MSPTKNSTSKASSSTVDIYDVPGPSTSRRYSSAYLHPDRARFNHACTIASSSREHNIIEVFIIKNKQNYIILRL